MLMTSEHRPIHVPIGDDDNYLGVSCSLQLALSAGELRLTSPDPHVQPFLDYRHLTDPFDTERLRGDPPGGRLAAHPAFQDLRDRVSPTDTDLASDQALDNWLMHNIGTSHHISGTCKMGLFRPLAVVDQHGGAWVDLRLRTPRSCRIAFAPTRMPRPHDRERGDFPKRDVAGVLSPLTQEAKGHYALRGEWVKQVREPT